MMAFTIFNLGTRWEWSVSRYGRFTTGERARGILWTGD